VHDAAALAAEQHSSTDHATGRLHDLQHGPHGHALAAAALAHDPHDLARRHVERHAVDRAHQSLVEEEVHAQVADRQQRVHQVPYGSAASRRPSPTRLKASTATITARPGTSSHGASASVWMFCASWSSTPHEMAGGRMPRPRNDSAVSLMIRTGMASVLVAMMWLRKFGTMWRPMMRARLAPASSAAST